MVPPGLRVGTGGSPCAGVLLRTGKPRPPNRQAGFGSDGVDVMPSLTWGLPTALYQLQGLFSALLGPETRSFLSHEVYNFPTLPDSPPTS